MIFIQAFKMLIYRKGQGLGATSGTTFGGYISNECDTNHSLFKKTLVNFIISMRPSLITAALVLSP